MSIFILYNYRTLFLYCITINDIEGSGDTNCDDVVDVSDADGSGKLDSNDVLYILRVIAKKV